MNITGLEVIRRNPGVAIVPNPGVVIGVVAGEKIELTYGDTLRVNVSFDYQGLALETTLEGAIGKLRTFPTYWLEVLLKNGVEIDLPKSPEFTHYERSVDISITSDIDPGTDYDLSVSLLDYREAGHPTEVDVIDIVGIPPTYELVYQHEYPLGKTYVGKAEECTATFTVPLPDQLFPNNWVIEKIADTFADEVAKEGGEMLNIKIYEDTTPLWHTGYRVVATAKASPLPWAVIIPLILAIVLVVAFITLIVQFKDIDWGEIPAPIPWAILALVGVGVLGVGAAVALAGRK